VGRGGGFKDKALKLFAKELLGYTDEQLRKALTARELSEIMEGVSKNDK